MKRAIEILSVLIIIFFLYQCKNTSKPSAADRAEIDALVLEFKTLEDSANYSWNKMMDDDDEKHLFMKRLLLEVSYTNVYDKNQFEILNAEIDALKDVRYDRVSMADSDLIDRYDSATFEVSRQVIEFARNHPSYEQFPLMEELINDINDKNGMILIYRIHYDGFAIQRNQLVTKEMEKIMDAMKNETINELPLFQLSS